MLLKLPIQFKAALNKNDMTPGYFKIKEQYLIFGGH